MYKKYFVPFMCFLCLLLPFSNIHSQELILEQRTGRVVYLCQEDIPLDVMDLQMFLQTGEIQLVTGGEILPPRITPGPAPAPYPAIDIKEKGIEQLGLSSENCDGIWFVNANLWHPKKWALVWWKIYIPDANQRLASEFGEDITLSLWVDWNHDRKWSQNEKVLCEAVNLQEYFPMLEPTLEIRFMSMFRIPEASLLYVMSEGNEMVEVKVWARGVMSYDDPDTSPDGECLFGEYEDYNIHYFEILKDKKIKS
ncbi:MAG: hypothetical protein KAV42_02905 [Candidatus Krumholzibacteria bacterium]|nr:hypothetical protein [Candidatus Krumholzibacteria bacterium]